VVVFEEDEAEEQPQLYDGVFLEVDADGDIVIPLVVEATREPDDVEEEEPVQDAAGNDLDDSGDDSSRSEDSSSEEEDGNEDEDEEDEDVDIEGLDDDNSAVANGEDNNNNQDGGNDNKMRMEMSRVMSIGIAELSIMSTPMLVRTICFVNCWKNCCRI
jgi:ribonuclease E